MPRSKDPVKAANQDANLRRGGAIPPSVDGFKPNLRHGGYAAIVGERLDEETAKVMAALAADAPLRHRGELPAADVARVQLLAEARCRLNNVAGYLRDRGWLDAKGAPRIAVLELERTLRAEVGRHLDALGMGPAARGKLGLDLARTVGAQAPTGGPDLTALTDEELVELRRLTAKANGGAEVIDVDPMGGER